MIKIRKMKLNKNKYYFRDLGFFLSLFGENVYAVGGYVRDIFLEKKREFDIDLLIVKTELDNIVKKLKKYGKVDIVGKSFGVIIFHYKGLDYEISLPRIDITDQSKKLNHKNFLVKADPELPIEKDLERRDFVCNSMCIHLKTGELIDPFGGLKDIKQKVLRMTNKDSFFDDPLRILRAARFKSKLNFTLEEEIYIKANQTNLKNLSSERITEELFKLIKSSEYPSIGLNEYFKLGILKQLFPEIYKMTLTLQDSEFHPETDKFGHHTVWGHTLQVVDNAGYLAHNERFDMNENERLILILSALLHDIGKINTTEWKWKRGRMTITSNNHDITGIEIVKSLFSRLKISKYKGYNIKHLVIKLLKYHHRIFDYWKVRESITKKTIANLYLEFKDDIKYLILLDLADKNGRDQGIPKKLDERGEWLLDKIKEYNLNKETIKPIIMGRDLLKIGVPSGPIMGKILDELYEIQLEDGFKTKEQGIKIAKNIISKYNINKKDREG